MWWASSNGTTNNILHEFWINTFRENWTKYKKIEMLGIHSLELHLPEERRGMVQKAMRERCKSKWYSWLPQTGKSFNTIRTNCFQNNCFFHLDSNNFKCQYHNFLLRLLEWLLTLWILCKSYIHINTVQIKENNLILSTTCMHTAHLKCFINILSNTNRGKKMNLKLFLNLWKTVLYNLSLMMRALAAASSMRTQVPLSVRPILAANPKP